MYYVVPVYWGCCWLGITLRKTDLGFPLARDLVVTHERRGLSAYVPAMREEGGGNDVVRAEVLKAAGNELFQNGHFKDAVEQYNDAIELNPEVKASPSTMMAFTGPLLTAGMSLLAGTHILYEPRLLPPEARELWARDR